MPKLINANPKYRKHKASGQAVITIGGRDIYLGPHNTRASRREYDRVIMEWLANDRRSTAPADDVTLTEVIAAYWKHAETYYAVDEGKSEGELDGVRLALRVLKRLYGPTPLADFGPKGFAAVQEAMIREGGKSGRTWSRNYVNVQMKRLRRIFRWVVSKEFLPRTEAAALLATLETVPSLKAGKSKARETAKVKAVPAEHVYAVLDHVSPQVGAMFQLQLITGARPSEIVNMRRSNLDIGGKVWTYTPEDHKSAHRGEARNIDMGKRCQAIIKPYLKPSLSAFLFSPAEAEAQRRAAMHARRKTPLSCGNVPGSNKRKKRKRAPKDRYTVASYRKAIYRGCDKADLWAKAGMIIGNDERVIPRWFPYMIRHRAGTDVREQYGLEGAQVVLGHKHARTTEIYAEINREESRRIAGERG